jgi:hypothetical protein
MGNALKKISYEYVWYFFSYRAHRQTNTHTHIYTHTHIQTQMITYPPGGGNYNIAFVNSERWLAKFRVDITQCQHGNVGKFLSLCLFVLYYKTNIKHFSVLIYSYMNTRGIWESRNCVKTLSSALRASSFHTISRFSNFLHSCWYNCI